MAHSTRLTGHQWATDIFRLRRRVLRKAELARLLEVAGFRGVTFLPQPSRWHRYEVLAEA